MLFTLDLTVPKNTLVGAPAEGGLKLTQGRITRIGLFFPPGCAAMVHAVVKDRLMQLLPANPDETINIDDNLVWSVMDYPLTDPPFEISVKAWSPGTWFAHEITLYIDLEPVKEEPWAEFMKRLFAPASVSESE